MKQVVGYGKYKIFVIRMVLLLVCFVPFSVYAKVDTEKLNTLMNPTMTRNFNLSLNRERITDVTADVSTDASSTNISFPVVRDTYYLIRKPSTVKPIVPTDRKAALQAGWHLIYWDGVHRETGLNWNSNYVVYKTDLKEVTEAYTVKTNYGMNNGSLVLSGVYDAGEILEANLDASRTFKGSLIWETAQTSDATLWTEVKRTIFDEEMHRDTYLVSDKETGMYMRVRFVTDETTGYQGSFIATTDYSVKLSINKVSILNNNAKVPGVYTIGDKLFAAIEPIKNESEVVYTWYHSDNLDTPIATGKNYELKGADVGKKLFVKATAKADGDLRDSQVSAMTSEVQTVQNELPAASGLRLVSKEDITATFTMDMDEGLYRYGIASVKGGVIEPYSILARANTKTIITGLTPGTTYFIYVQQIGENGYVSSSWSTDCLEFKTENEHVKGDVVIGGRPIYNTEITMDIKNNPDYQTGEFVWYPLDKDGNRIDSRKVSGNKYLLKEEDIGNKIEAVYEGVNGYNGFVSTVTNVIEKEDKVAPTDNVLINSNDDTSISVKMPTSTTGEQYILGISNTKTGIPIERLEDDEVKVFNSGEEYVIDQLERDTDYYIFIKYASSATYQKSDWINVNQAEHVKTERKDFAGDIDFVYEFSRDELMVGQTITAMLKPEISTFNYKGEWTWFKVSSDGTEKEITDYVLTSDKRGTSYVIPVNEEVGTNYKVRFMANVGFQGFITNVSTDVKKTVKIKYDKPLIEDMDLEAIDDSSFKVKMNRGAGQYRFWYKKVDTSLLSTSTSSDLYAQLFVAGNDGYIDTSKNVYSNVDVVVDGLDRNADYIVKVQRIDDATGNASDFTYSTEGSLSVTTKKTDIAGYIELSGTAKIGETLSAEYIKANYASTGLGDDSNGLWQWYLGDTKISGATSKTYVVQKTDVGDVLKVEYSIPNNSHFTGSAYAKTSLVSKMNAASPEFQTVESTFDTNLKKIKVDFSASVSSAEQKVYYRIQRTTELPPVYPTEQTISTWTENTQSTTSLTLDSNGIEFTEKGAYTIYLIKMGTSSIEASSMVTSNFIIGQLMQSGTVSLSGDTHVSKKLTATLNNANNNKGAWHWYYSTTDYTNTSPTSWVELTNGFYPTTNDNKSILVVPDNVKGKYLKAEFVADETVGYKGKVSSGKSSSWVTKTFTERLELIGNSYQTGTLTVKLFDSDRDLTKTTSTGGTNELFNKRGVQIQNKRGSAFADYTTIKNVTRDSFQITVPTTWKSYDGDYLIAIINSPDKNIYKNADGSNIADYVYSPSEKRFQFNYGIPITNTTDFSNFMQGIGNYSNRKGQYVITDNINMASVGNVKLSDTVFSGTLNGAGHSVTNLKSSIFKNIQSSIIKDLIVNSQSVINNTVASGNSAASVALGSYGGNAFKRVFLSQAVVQSGWDTGYFIGKIYNGDWGQDSFAECGSAGGKVSTASSEARVVSGFVGYIDTGGFASISNSSSLRTEVVGKQSNYVSGVTTIGANANVAIYNFISASTISHSTTDTSKKGSIVLKYQGNGNVSYFQNAYYDSTLAPGLTSSYSSGTAKSTLNLIGTSLKSAFSQDDLWTYTDGFYPRLKWLENNSIETLFAATRGSFTSLDNSTGSTDMFNGNISGPIEVSEELKSANYVVTSDRPDILKVVNNTIIPVGAVNSSANIRITYNEPNPKIGGSAVNTYNFTVKKKVNAINKVNLTGSAQYGKTLSVDTDGVATNYQWYRKKSGTTVKEKIVNAVSSTYTIKPEDIGYELAVEVSGSNSAKALSNYSQLVTSITPVTGPVVMKYDDNSITLKQDEIDGMKYEFAYLEGDSNELTILENVYDNNVEVKIDRLLRNTTYQLYTRVAGGEGYSASNFSPVTTVKTDQTSVVGDIIMGSNINNGSEFTMSFPDTNGQTGVWKLERVLADGVTPVAVIDNDYSTDYNCSYIFTAADVNYRIRATFTGTGNYAGSQVKVSNIVKKELVAAPVSVQFVSSTDSAIKVSMLEVGTFDIGLATELNGEIIPMFTEVSNGTEVELNNLVHNKDYYIYARKSVTDASEASLWSTVTIARTQKSTLTGTLMFTGVMATDEKISFQAPSVSQLTGTWMLERIMGSSRTTISPSNYQVDTATNKLSYKISSKDAGSKFRAVFTASYNFAGSISLETTDVVVNADQGIDGLPTVVEVFNQREYSIDVKAKSGTDIYQYGYATHGSSVVHTVDATAESERVITINGLKRNTNYDIYIRKAAKFGYNSSAWKHVTSGSTIRSSLLGIVNYTKIKDGIEEPAKVGVASIGTTYKASYQSGVYEQSGDDSLAGEWQWYANDKLIEGATTDTYTVKPMQGTPDIIVKYVASADSDFKDNKSVNVGTLTKPIYDVPAVPLVKALPEDGKLGSRLMISSGDVDNVFYYVRKASNEKVPAVVVSDSAIHNEVREEQWFKATSEVVLTVDVNTEYVVYITRLASDSYQYSGVVSQRAIRTVKENLASLVDSSILETDNTKWKVLQEKQLQLKIPGKQLPTGVWQYYVSKTPELELSWQNITSEIKDSVSASSDKENNAANTFINIPLKYSNGYYVRVVFIGRGDYEGTKTYQSTVTLEGIPIKGHIEIENAERSSVLAPIKAKYVYFKNTDGTDIIDESNGVWTWYRETGANTKVYEEIKRTGIYVGLTDQYTPTALDVNKRIYAVYTGAREGIYSGSIESNKLNNVERSLQNIPVTPAVKQVNGTTVQMSLPANYKVDGTTIPEITLEYRIAGTEAWIVNGLGDSWLGKNVDLGELQANTEYEVRAKFEGTSEYNPSAYSSVTMVKTNNYLFDDENLTVETDTDVLVAGSTVSAKFTGNGYSDGYFVVERSDGQVVVAKETGQLHDNQVSFDYVCDQQDIGNNMIIKFQAKDDALKYGGAVSKTTNEVVKTVNPTILEKQVLEPVRLHEDQLRFKVNDQLEYVLTDSAESILDNSFDWQKFKPDSEGYYTFKNLDSSTGYYLHARYHETEVYKSGADSTSNVMLPWARSTYNISYLGLDGITGTLDNPISYTELDSDIKLNNPTKVGYKFLGWSTPEILAPKEEMIIVSGSSLDKIFTANWQVKQYTITFDTNGGSATTTVERDYNSSLGNLPTPTKEGYEFVGWYTHKTDGAMINENTLVTAENVTYYARWKINQYEVRFESNGGSAVDSKKIEYKNKLLEPTVPHRDGYTFSGWYHDETLQTKWNFDTDEVLRNTVLYAKWEPIKYKIEYQLDGGSEVANPIEYTIETSDITLINPTRDNYSFLGWTYSGQAEPSTSVTISKGSIGEKVFKANWKKFDFKVEFETNSSSIVEPSLVAYEEKLIQPTDPINEGYTLVGWYKDSTLNDIWEFDKDTVIENMTLYAKWEINHYKVSFNTSNGVVLPEQPLDHGEKVNKPNELLREYYQFDGWYTEADFKTKWDFDNDILKSSMTLFAKWNPIKFQIDYQMDNGINSVDNPDEYTIDSADITLKEPTREGYTFVGWTTAMQKDPVKKVVIKKGTVGNQDYTANWKLNEYLVSFDTDGGGTIANSSVTHGGMVLKPADPEKSGYVFDGWYFDKNFIQLWNFDTDTITAKTTLYAKYKMILGNIKTSFEPGSIEKGTAITLLATNGAAIYYTTDGTMPTKDSSKYVSPIVIDKTTTVKAIAIADDYVDSQVSTFVYAVRGNATIDKGMAPIVSENEMLIKSVLTNEEYQNYLVGNDIKLRFTYDIVEKNNTLEMEQKLNGLVPTYYYDINVYKRVGNKAEEKVSVTTHPIKLVLTIPKELYAKNNIKRIFSVLRVHGKQVDLLNDLDENEHTVTIETNVFSTYVLCYKDELLVQQQVPVAPATRENGDVSALVVDQVSESNKTDDSAMNKQQEESDEENDDMIYESKKEDKKPLWIIPTILVVIIGSIIFYLYKRRDE